MGAACVRRSTVAAKAVFLPLESIWCWLALGETHPPTKRFSESDFDSYDTSKLSRQRRAICRTKVSGTRLIIEHKASDLPMAAYSDAFIAEHVNNIAMPGGHRQPAEADALRRGRPLG